MRPKWLYLIGAVMASIYLLYGLVSLTHSLFQNETQAIRPRKVKLPEIPDIQKRIKNLSNIKIRKDLFGKRSIKEIVTKPAKQEYPVETTEDKTLSLKGIIITPEGQFRAVLKPEDSKAVTVTTGDEINGYTVQAISRTEVVLKKGPDRIRLTLYKKPSGE